MLVLENIVKIMLQNPKLKKTENEKLSEWFTNF